MTTHIFYLGFYLILITIFSFLIKKERIKRKKTNEDLKESNQELLQVTSKLSLFNESIKNVKNQLSEIINVNQTVNSSMLFRVENFLDELILEKGIWQEYKLQFEKNYPEFSCKLHQRNPNLSINDYKHATFIRLNMSVKEVASLTKMNPKAIEIARYRLKKKLNLTKKVALKDYLKTI